MHLSGGIVDIDLVEEKELLIVLFSSHKVQLVPLVPDFEEGPIFQLNDISGNLSRIWHVPSLDDIDIDDDDSAGGSKENKAFTVLLTDSTKKIFSRLFLFELSTSIEDSPIQVDSLTFIATDPKTFFFDRARGVLFLVNKCRPQPNCFIVKMKKDDAFSFSHDEEEEDGDDMMQGRNRSMKFEYVSEIRLLSTNFQEAKPSSVFAAFREPDAIDFTKANSEERYYIYVRTQSSILAFTKQLSEL